MDAAYEAATGFEKLNVRRSTIPAVTHVDGSARIQTVDRQRHPLLHQLLTRFYEQTGCPLLINTSFNVRGEPLVCTPQEAYRCFQMTEMDALVMGRHIILKTSQRQQAGSEQRKEYLAQFQPD